MPSPVTLKIKFKAANLQQFIERYAVDVSKGGIFIRTPKPLAVGTALKFEFQLQDGGPLLSGAGTVVWIREPDPSKGGGAPGMGVRFDQLPPESQKILDEVLTQKQRAAEAAEFQDQPTRVADLAAAADLGAGTDEVEQPVRAKDTLLGLGDISADRAAASALSPEPMGAAGEFDEAAETSPVTPAPAAPVAEPADRKAHLAKILFSSDETPGPSESEPPPPAEPVGAPPLDAGEPAPAPRESKSSVLLWLIIIVLLGSGAFIAWKFLDRSRGGPKPDEKAQPVLTPDTGVKAPEKPAGIAVNVESEPGGAKIIIDGKDTGKITPAELEGIDPAREIEVRLDLPGKKLYTEKVTPKAGEPIKATLEKDSSRRVQISSEPPGASVTLDGKRIGKTPIDYKKPIAPSKPHELVFTLDGHVEAKRELTAGGGMRDPAGVAPATPWTREGEDEVLVVAVTLEKKGAKAEPKAEPKAAPKTEPKAEPKAEPTVEPKAKTATKPKKKIRKKKDGDVAPTGDEPSLDTKPEPEPKPEPKPEEKKEGVKKPSWME